MGGEGVVAILEKKFKKSKFKVCKIWSLNLTAIVGKFGYSEVFIAIGREIT
jgi:hypothetical protein